MQQDKKQKNRKINTSTMRSKISTLVIYSVASMPYFFRFVK